MNAARWALLIGVSVVFAGCVVGPDYRRPSALLDQPVPERFLNATSSVPWKLADTFTHTNVTGWWQVFADPHLNELLSELESANPTLQVAQARWRQARAQVDVARAGWFPHVTASASVQRERTSENQFERSVTGAGGHTFNTFSVPFEAGWEPDLWGRVRRQTEAARANLKADAADLAGTRLALQAELAANYFTFLSLEAELAVLRRNQTSLERALELTRHRRAGGIATDLEVAQAEAQVRTVQAALPATELLRARTTHALAALVGRVPSTFTSPALPNPLPPVPPTPTLLPSEWLERRPDIAAAEQRMAAANAGIGLAQAAFYPQIRLSGLAGLRSADAGTLLEWPSRFWAVGPRVDWAVFQGGRNRARLAISRAQYDETVARYRQTVVEAFQEVEDQLTAQRRLDEQATAVAGTLAAAQRVLALAENRYRAGLVSYLEVVTAQNAVLAQERQHVRLQTEQRIAAVSLIKAIGGGWMLEAP